MLDYLFAWMAEEATLPKIEDVLLYEIPNRNRRCAQTPIPFLNKGKFVVEIQDLRKSMTGAGRPYFTIEMLILESSNKDVKIWSQVQEMYMLDVSSNMKKSITFLEKLLESPKDLTIERLHFMLSEQDVDNWNSPFAGATMSVNVKEIEWDGGKRTISEFEVWK